MDKILILQKKLFWHVLKVPKGAWTAQEELLALQQKLWSHQTLLYVRIFSCIIILVKEKWAPALVKNTAEK